MTAAITSGVLALVLAAYGLVARARIGRLRSAAAALNGTYADATWLRPGRIVGPGFTVRIVKVRRSFLTYVDVRARDVPGAYVLNARFFELWPDWDHVKVPQEVSQRAFFFNVRFPGYGPPDDRQRDALWRWLTRGATDRRLPFDLVSAARITSIVVGDGCVSTSFRGLVSDAGRLRRTIDLLGRLAS